MVSAMSERGGASADVVVAGSGPAGVSAAWPLVQAGLNVLMLDASDTNPLPEPPAGHIGAFRADPSRWAHQFGTDLAGLGLDGNQSPKQMTPRGRAAMGGFAAAAGIEASGFVALGSMAQGGLSTVWGALAAIYDEADLAGYPIRRSDLEPSYRAVMTRIGVSGGRSAEGLPIDDGPPLSAPVAHIFDRYVRRGERQNVSLERATNAVLMRDRAERKACDSSGLCLWGCLRKSIYNSGYEIPELKRFANFDYRPRTLLHRLLADTEGHLLEVESAGERSLISAKYVVLAAGTLVTTGLVLHRLGLDGLSVGLLSNPAGALAFIVPKYVGMPLPDRSFALGQLIYRVPLGAGDHAAGVIYAADALPLQGIAGRIPLSRPVALRLARALAPALLLASCYLPGRFSANRLSLRCGRDGASLIVEGEQTIEAKHMLKEAGQRLARGLRALGAFALPGSLTLAQPGSDGHYAGTLPMGAGGALGTSASGELNACPGVYIVDGAALPHLPAKHCTLTIMANADRIGRILSTRIANGRFSRSTDSIDGWVDHFNRRK
jgi:choline dehydrogenase-like flavoprotein